MNMQPCAASGQTAGAGCGDAVEADQRGCFEFYITTSPLE